MKSYYDFRIFYKEQEITNIFSIVEECSYAYGNEEQIDALVIKHVDEKGKLVIKKYNINDLNFKSNGSESNEE